MRNLKAFVAVGSMLATAGCVESTGYPTTSYGYGSGYGSQPVYYSRPTYYSAPPPVVVTQTRYVAVPVAVPPSRQGYYRDRNRDGIPDRYQQRRY